MDSMDIERAENEGMPTLFDMPDEKTEHEELMEMLGGLFIQTSRVYDVLMAMLPQTLEEELDEVHSAGRLAFSPPTLLEKGWDEAPVTEK